jgi:phage terminase Nu1 subunit (DNA packaging protein)
MILLQDSDAICSAKQLGEVIGRTSRQIERLVDSHVLKPVRCKLRGKHFRLSESVQLYQRHREEIVKRDCAKGDDSYNAARTSRMLALAQIEQLRAKQLRGELIKREDADATFMTILRNCRDQLRAIPSRTMHPLTGMSDAKEINLLLKTEIDTTLTRLANAGEKAKIRHEIKRHHETVDESPNGEDDSIKAA